MVLDDGYDMFIFLYSYFMLHACGTIFIFFMRVGCHLFLNTVISVSKKIINL